MKLVLLRHGQSTWNLENRFTGWVDVPLSEAGRVEARNAGVLLSAEGFVFDIIHTSVLSRALQTTWIVQEEMGQSWVEVRRHWRLNERHYGALQGLDKKETAARFGDAQVHLWRRSYDVPPPPLPPDDPMQPRRDVRYRSLAPDVLPDTECLKDVVARMLPYYHDRIVPDLRAGKQVLIAAHGNSLRALMKHLDHISDEAIADVNIPTGIPLVYELDHDLRPTGRRYLGDPEAAKKAAEAVAAQSRATP